MSGEEFASIRNELGLTQGDMLIYIGFKQRTVQDWEIKKVESIPLWAEKAILLLYEKLKGKMKESRKDKNIEKISTDDNAPYLVNTNASAGLNFLTQNGDPTSYIKIPGSGVDVYINVFGDSMYPKYCAGEIIGIKLIEKDDLFFGHAYVVQMNDGEAYIKYIQPGKDDEHWSLESENKKYPPRQFHLSKIDKIYKIKTTVTKDAL